MSKPVALSLNTLTGHKVQNAAGEDRGKIEDLVLDESSGRILYAVLSFGGFLGMGNRLVAIPWVRLRLQSDHKGFILIIDNETLEHAPSFNKEHWPDMSLPEWRDRTETYFAYNPAEAPQMKEGDEFFRKGLALAKQGRWKEALKAYEESLQVNPGSAQTYLNLGFVY